MLLAVLLAFLLLFSFGWGLLRPTVERQLTRSIGREVRIGSIARVGGPSLDPLLELTDVHVAQPAWAGRGDMVALRRGRIRLPLLPLLRGKVRPQAVLIEGLRARLVRLSDGRANWEPDEKRAPSGGDSPDLGHMTVRDGQVELDDRERDRHLALTIAMDPTGLRVTGTGTIAGGPATLKLEGAPVAEQRAWPFTLTAISPHATLRAAGRMRAPLDLGHFTAAIRTSGRDLRDLDRLVEAGLPGTQDYRLQAVVTHDRPAWRIEQLRGTIGRSGIAGRIAVHKDGERTLLQGEIASNGLDFDDFATDEGLARAAAEKRHIGDRMVPATKIDLSNLRRLDGTLHVRARRLLFKAPQPFRSLDASVTLDHGVLTAAPVTVGLTQGALRGTAVVRHQSGTPRLHLDLRMTGARLEQVITDPKTATGVLAGHLVLTGNGETVRAAVGRATGTIGFAARGGTTDRRIAFAAGADIGRALMAGAGDRVPLRCMIVRFQVKDGTGTPAPLLLDSSVSQARGQGSLRLADERLALTMTGLSKQGGGLRITEPLRIDGTLSKPHLTLPHQVQTAGGILKIIGRAIRGNPGPVASDADCRKLTALALR